MNTQTYSDETVLIFPQVEGEPQGYLKKVINNCIAHLQADVKGQHGLPITP